MKVLTGKEELRELSRDAGIIELVPFAAYVASSETEVIEAVSRAQSNGLSLTPRGGGTSIPSQSVGRGIILLQERKASRFTPTGGVECEPALLKSEFNAVLDTRGCWMPVDPSSYQMCSVGGMVANNSSGSRTVKYKSTIDYVEELRVVLPEEGLVRVGPLSIDAALSAAGTTGQVARLLVENQQAIRDEAPRVTKNSSGYRLDRVVHGALFDLPKLFVGSEGTLGIVTLVKFATRTKPVSRALLIFETGLTELNVLVASLRAHAPSALELVDKSVFTATGKGDKIRGFSRTDEEYLVFCEFDGSTPEEVTRALEAVSIDPQPSGFEPVAMTDRGDIARAWELRNETLTVAA
ncbi:MAG: FAD-binding oxidoreductase, partial [Nitrososphaerales archaeon]|nr:FAD-binding oxidoreductase [Nitrososphaerales archaeon]